MARHRTCMIWAWSHPALTARVNSRNVRAISVDCSRPTIPACIREMWAVTGQFARRPCRRASMQWLLLARRIVINHLWSVRLPVWIKQHGPCERGQVREKKKFFPTSSISYWVSNCASGFWQWVRKLKSKKRIAYSSKDGEGNLWFFHRVQIQKFSGVVCELCHVEIENFFLF